MLSFLSLSFRLSLNSESSSFLLILNSLFLSSLFLGESYYRDLEFEVCSKDVHLPRPGNKSVTGSPLFSFSLFSLFLLSFFSLSSSSHSLFFSLSLLFSESNVLRIGIANFIAEASGKETNSKGPDYYTVPIVGISGKTGELFFSLSFSSLMDKKGLLDEYQHFDVMDQVYD